MGPRVAIAAAGAILVLVAVSACPSQARAAEKAVWGPAQLPDGTSAFPVYQALSVDTLEMEIDWSSVAPARPSAPRDPADPAYHWPRDVDLAAVQSARTGIHLALVIRGSPGWANGGRSSIWAPQNPQDYADFVAAAARRYRDVHRWMIWGEPNKDDRFQPNRADDPVSARTYASLLDAAYVALKRRSARNRVIGGMTWTNGTVKPPDFLRWMRLPDGKRPRLDWFGHNPFPFRFPKLANGPLLGYRDISDMDTFSREVQRAYKRPVPLWLSEYTIQTDRGSNLFATFVSERSQARYLTAGYEIADDLGRRVAGIGWLSLLDEPQADGSANWGVVTYGLRRKPAFAALARAPSERLRPRVTVRRSRARGTPVLKVVIKPRRGGLIHVDLLHGGTRVTGVRVRGTVAVPRTVRLHRGPLARGRYTVVVRANGAAAVRRNMRIR